MYITMFKSKIHRARVTQAKLHYPGSLTLDPVLMEAAGLRVHEQVHVLNITNGQRFETYTIEGERGSGVVCLNGACARLGEPGDLVIVLSYAQMTPEEADTFQPTCVYVDSRNKIVSTEAVSSATA